jgi:ElaB/YqjD/DUF883 family membrane-anchored ribosome-binding protein
VRLQRELDEGDTEVIKCKFDGVKKENERLRKELKDVYDQCEENIAQLQQDADRRLEEVKER